MARKTPLICKSTYIALGTGITFSLLSTAITPVSNAQTVIVGGGNAAPVTVNMNGLNNSQGYVLQPRQSPFASARTVAAQPPQASIDYNKPAEIRYGDEVIKLVPPGSQPKKPVAPVVKAKPKPAPKPAVAAAPQKTEPAQPKATVQKSEPKVAVTAEKAAPAPAPEKTVAKAVAPAPAPAPKMVKEAAPATAESPKEPAKEATEKPATPTTETAKAAPPKPAELKPEAAKEMPAKIEPTAPKSEEMQVASIAEEEKKAPVSKKPAVEPIQKSNDDKINQILFEEGETKLPSTASSKLEDIAKSIDGNNDRIQLVAYANASSNGTARRLSLGRALVIRSKLMELGVPNNKIEVRALGRPDDDSPADRVDLKLVAR